jgi:hypothetical protein
VVGTILLLALTVTLFSSIFFFVSTFPSPAPQPSNQFSAYLTYNSGATKIIGVTILHLAGPAVPGTALVYLYSSAAPTRFTAPFSVSSGINNSQAWTLGTSWFKNVTSFSLTTPDNITISVVTNTELLFRVTLPGFTPNTPPTFTGVGTIPAVPSAGQSFQIYAIINDPNLNPNSVFANLSLVPGVTGTGLNKMTYTAALGAYTYTVPAGTSKGTGTFYLFVNATDKSGLKNSVAFQVTFTASASSLAATLQVSNSAPVVNTTVVVTDLVSNGGTSGLTIQVTFQANGVSLGSSAGSVASGSTGAFPVSWTPTLQGVYTLTALANSTGGTVAGASLNITVFPTILVISHNVPAGVRTANNESGYLQQELTAAGIPYTSMFVACASALPASATLNTFDEVVVDFGSTWIGGCPKFPSTTEQGKLTGTTGVGVMVVGANAFGSTTCTSYTSAYFSLFGITWAASGTCMSLPNATSTATWTGSPGSGVRSDGIPASMTFNKTLGSSSAFVPYDTFSLGTTNTAFLKAGGNPVGAFKGTGYRGVAIASDPALLAGQLPNANNWGTGAAGTSVLYNTMNFLMRLATSSASGRALNDFAVSQVSVVGLSHTKATVAYVGLRANGPVSGLVAATLYVNGSVATYQGVIVSVSSTVNGVGGLVWFTLTWIAPSNGPFTLSVAIVSLSPGDLYSLNDQMSISPLNQATTFT